MKERMNIQGSGINARGCLYGVDICRFMSEVTSFLLVNNCVNKQSKTKKCCNKIVDNDATTSIH